MTTQTELLEILTNGENSGVEFKRDHVKPEDLAKELVAFSNLEGGTVVLGVEDDGTVSGLARSHSDLEEWVMNVCRDKIRPAIVPFFTVIHKVEGDKDVAIVRVVRGFGVHALWHNNIRRYLIRVGTQSRDADQEELARLFQQRRAIRAELQPVSGTTIEHLDRRRLRNYFQGILGIELPENEEEWQSLLSNVELMEEGCVAVGGLLLFGSTPNRFLPHAGINAVAYPGTDKDYAARERATLRGPMTPLRDANGEIVETGLVEQATEFIRRNTPVSAYLKDGTRRVDRPTYPDKVTREAVVNALIHRDYLLTGTEIELSIYNDRLEIISPGRLPNNITLDRMRAGARAARNELLKTVMRDYGYLEGVGMGVRRIIIKGMKEHNGTEPDLIEEHGRFSVRLSAKAPNGENDA